MNRTVVVTSRQRDRGLRGVVRFRAALVVLVVLVAMQGGSASAVAQGSQAARSSDVVLDGRHLSIARAVAVARHDATVIIPAQAMRRVQRSFEVLLEAAREDKPIYGLTRGVGENKDKTIFKGGQIDAAARRLSEQFNANLLRVQATAFGAPASVEVVRAAMVIRLNQMLTGHAGVQQSVVQGLEDFLNRAITPVVPSKGTVGEADIDILAHIGLALMGEGDVEYHGATIPAAAALSQAGLMPIVPFAKDALSIFSSNAFSAGIAVLAAHDANHLLGGLVTYSA